ncbi:MAG: C39 family peptidase [Patescibacteria group bacterium]|nr:C39 family peptidase [Patescibacteria group bacterium]MDD5164111.1 C39 family peptidase [Patescibacteria group bacterium]MDD5534231.1 C39 family peptidase [Patescibacteria group bacterium]
MAKNNRRIAQKIIIIFVTIATVFVFDFWLFSPKDLSKKEVVPAQTNQTEKININQSVPGQSKTINKEIQPLVEDNKTLPETREIKSSVNLSVPFVSQAPFGKWDDLHNEACEETALIIAKYWLNNQKLSPTAADQEILSSVGWQIDNFGGHYDLSAENIIKMAQQYFGFEKIYLTPIKNIDDIKYQLSQGNLVIVPTAGRLLENPHYQQPGPVYHILVVKGYDDKKIITNDPGTKHGENFSYFYNNFWNSIHDWPFSLGENEDLSKDEKATEILNGPKIMIVIEKNN